MFSTSSAKILSSDPARLLSSYFSSDLLVEGDIRTTGVANIHGTIQGNVTADKANIFTEARVSGDVTASEVLVSGRVVGEVTGNRVSFERTSEVSGIVKYGTLAVEPGAVVDAQIIFIKD